MPGSHRDRLLECAATMLFILLLCSAVDAQTTTFTYQGRLTDSGAVANGQYDLQLALFDAATGGTQVGPTLVFDGNSSNPPAVQVTNGVFTVQLDFGSSPNPFATGAARYLEIAVKHPADANYVTLAGRQPITSPPYAIRSLTATTAGTATTATSTTNFSGTLSGDVTGTQSATVVSAVGGKSATQMAGSVTDVGRAGELQDV